MFYALKPNIVSAAYTRSVFFANVGCQEPTEHWKRIYNYRSIFSVLPMAPQLRVYAAGTSTTVYPFEQLAALFASAHNAGLAHIEELPSAVAMARLHAYGSDANADADADANGNACIIDITPRIAQLGLTRFTQRITLEQRHRRFISAAIRVLHLLFRKCAVDIALWNLDIANVTLEYEVALRTWHDLRIINIVYKSSSPTLSVKSDNEEEEEEEAQHVALFKRLIALRGKALTEIVLDNGTMQLPSDWYKQIAKPLHSLTTLRIQNWHYDNANFIPMEFIDCGQIRYLDFHTWPNLKSAEVFEWLLACPKLIRFHVPEQYFKDSNMHDMIVKLAETGIEGSRMLSLKTGPLPLPLPSPSPSPRVSKHDCSYTLRF